MKIYNEIDEQGRYCGFKATTETGKQVNTRTHSYLYVRKLSQEVRVEMGFDKKNKLEKIMKDE